jgi:hypothetical protein
LDKFYQLGEIKKGVVKGTKGFFGKYGPRSPSHENLTCPVNQGFSNQFCDVAKVVIIHRKI